MSFGEVTLKLIFFDATLWFILHKEYERLDSLDPPFKRNQ